MLAKIREYINYHANKKILGFIFLLVILAALPLTVIISQQQQQIRQRASELVSPPFVLPPTPPPSDTTILSLSGSLMGDPPRVPSGTVTIQIAIIDPVTKNVSFNLSGQLAGLPSDRIYEIYVCKRDRNECATNSSPPVISNTEGKANFDGIRFSLINTPDNPISSVRVHDKKGEFCPMDKTPCLQSNYSVPIPTVTPKGAYSFSLSNTQTKITCAKGDPNCKYTTVLIAKNKIDKPLYKTTIYTSDPNQIKTLTYVDFDGSTKTGQGNPSPKVVLPGEEAISTYITFTPPPNSDVYYATLYIDGQICNQTTPPDCYFYGASSLDIKMNISGNTVTIDVVNNFPPVLPSPTPTPTPTSTPTPIPALIPVCNACSADINRDGVADGQDIALLGQCFLKPPTGTCVNADLNKDGTINIQDISCVANNFGKQCAPTPTLPPPTACTACSADINRDKIVDAQDFSITRSCFNKPATGNCINADVNKDGKIDMIDLNCISRNFFKQCVLSPPTPTPTPYYDQYYDDSYD